MKMKAGRVEKMIRYSARTTGMGDDERTEGRRIRLLLEQISLEHAEKKAFGSMIPRRGLWPQV